MARLILYYAHPGQRHSRANAAMFAAAGEVDDITCVDLYAEYPRFAIDVDREQKQLLNHDVLIFQFPLFWYSTPSLVKEWLDLVLEYGFAYGEGGIALQGKRMMLAVTAAGSEEAYSLEGYQGQALETFLTPLQQISRICKMVYLPPYVLFSALQAPDTDRLAAHVHGYRRLLLALRDDRYDIDHAMKLTRVCSNTLPITAEA